MKLSIFRACLHYNLPCKWVSLSSWTVPAIGGTGGQASDSEVVRAVVSELRQVRIACSNVSYSRNDHIFMY